MEIKFRTLAIISVLVIFLMGGLFWYNTYLKKVITQRENTIKVKSQNEAALKDSIKMKADSLQNFSISVKNLQRDNDNYKTEYSLLKNKYTILIDSVKILNANANVDTSGNTIVINFEGKQGKVSYKGHTTYFKLTGKGTYTINIGVDPSKINSVVYFDKSDSLIKNRIYADGSLISDASTTIDSSLYILYRNNNIEQPNEQGFFDRLHLTVDAHQVLRKDALVFVPYQFSLNLGTEYQFNKYRVYGSFDIINSEVRAGITYHPSIADLWKAIF